MLITKPQHETLAKIVKRGLLVLNKHRLPEECVQTIDLSMDIEYTHYQVPLDFDKFLAFEDFNFLHDIVGIYSNLNRTTKTLDNHWMPRCAA
jgi:hypothetical protein